MVIVSGEACAFADIIGPVTLQRFSQLVCESSVFVFVLKLSMIGGKKEYLSTINILWPFLTVPWFDLQYAIVVFPDHTHLPFAPTFENVIKYTGIH